MSESMFGNAAAYEAFMGRWSRLLAPPFIEFLCLPQGAHLLDVGCGVGSLSNCLAQGDDCATIQAIDASEHYVAFARTRNLYPDRVDYAVGNAQDLPFDGETFAAYASLLVYNFLPDPRRALLEALRVTQPGGLIGAAVWDYGQGMRMLREYWAAATSIDPVSDPLNERNMNLAAEGELADLWTSVGLADVYQEPIDIVMPFNNFADYWEPFLLGQGPSGAHAISLSESERAAMREELKRRLEIDDEASPFALPSRAWAVRGIVPD